MNWGTMTKKRLVWIDEVETELRAYADRKHTCGQTQLANGILKAVNHLQTISTAKDAVEVKHGRWVLVKPRRTGRNATYKCTACGKLRSSYYNDVQEWKYCPCGAKMDGDGNA